MCGYITLHLWHMNLREEFLVHFELIIFLLPTSKTYIHRVGFTKKSNATEISSSVTLNL